MDDVLTNNEVLEYLAKIINTLELDEQQNYMSLELAYQLKDELCDTLELDD